MQRDRRSTDTGAAPSTLRRQRLWELPPAAHGPLVGLALSPEELRRAMDRLFHGESVLHDTALHAAVVAQCVARNKVSEALQRAFDARFVQALNRFRAAKSLDAVEVLWREALADGTVAAGFWAATTHPCATAAFQTDVCREVQAAQCRAVAAVANERRRADELLYENGVLTREMARIQQRQTRWHAERRAEQAELTALRLDLVRLKAEIAGRERAVEKAGGQDVRDAAPSPATAVAERAMRRTVAVRAEAVVVPAEVSEVEDAAAVGSLVDAVGEARRILCVGGRVGHVPAYRALVEQHGGRFLHHDGGIEDNVRRLDAQLGAADLVICQTGCLSHNAYWRVKDHCKRTGTPCVYLDKPGTGSFLRGLAAGSPAPKATPVPTDALDGAGD